jgi:hypothetical protein
LVGAGLAGTVGIVNARMDYNQAVDGAQAAFDQEMQALDRLNHQLVLQKKAKALAGRSCKQKFDEEDCDEMYETDLETCRKLKSRACYAQAAERWAACKVGRPIPPFPFRLPN